MQVDADIDIGEYEVPVMYSFSSVFPSSRMLIVPILATASLMNHCHFYSLLRLYTSQTCTALEQQPSYSPDISIMCLTSPHLPLQQHHLAWLPPAPPACLGAWAWVSLIGCLIKPASNSSLCFKWIQQSHSSASRIHQVQSSHSQTKQSHNGCCPSVSPLGLLFTLPNGYYYIIMLMDLPPTHLPPPLTPSLPRLLGILLAGTCAVRSTKSVDLLLFHS